MISSLPIIILKKKLKAIKQINNWLQWERGNPMKFSNMEKILMSVFGQNYCRRVPIGSKILSHHWSIIGFVNKIWSSLSAPPFQFFLTSRSNIYHSWDFPPKEEDIY